MASLGKQMDEGQNLKVQSEQRNNLKEVELLDLKKQA